jgi:hypothetical protein
VFLGSFRASLSSALCAATREGCEIEAATLHAVMMHVHVLNAASH